MKAVAYLVALAFAVMTVPVALLFLGVSATWDGRLAGAVVLVAGLGAPLAARGWLRESKAWRRAGAILGLISLAGVTILFFRAPTPGEASGARVRNIRPDSPRNFGRANPVHLVPEADQLLAAFTIAMLIDPLFTHQQAAELKRLTREIYAELERDAEFHSLESAMSGTYRDACSFSTGPEDAFVYVPRDLARTGPAPVLVFFHGSGGNFKAYLWLLARLADRAKLVVVAPSGGMGNWTPSRTRRALEIALRATAQFATIDRTQVHLMGLSNGGLAVSQAGADEAMRFKSLIFLSPVFDGTGVRAKSFAAAAPGRPVLVLSGTADDRVPLDYVAQEVATMRSAGISVTFEPAEGANHFLIFSRRDAVIERIGQWIRTGREP